MIRRPYTSQFTVRQVRLFACVLVMSMVAVFANAADDDELRRRRADRRDRSRTSQEYRNKDDGPSLFGLLVIPVDFADERLPAAWDPSGTVDRLQSPSGESLYHYYQIASGSRLDLRITVAPLIRLTGTRRDYSDIDYFGFSRSRAMATEALEAVRDLGIEFRRLDMDGPDRVPGTADDDGEIDGVLILHAGPGQENDPVDGLIQPLQFFLEDPVVSQGVEASFYAVASLSSGPGIWAHETGHLLGLEDRYDPLLKPEGGSEVQSRGGLGRFSLMASGAWGIGGGYGAALPDGYSSAQLGWVDMENLQGPAGGPVSVRASIDGGKILRAWTGGKPGPEYFLLEVRDPVAAYPFDAEVPGGNLLIYHVDENLAEGEISDDPVGQYHLRVRLVEADADGKLALGEDDGRAEDQFPGPLGVDRFGPLTIPPSSGYSGPSAVDLTEITSLDGEAIFSYQLTDQPDLDFTYGFSSGPAPRLELDVRSTGSPALTDLTCLMVATGDTVWGTFAGGGLSVSIPMAESDPDVWRPSLDVDWIPDPGVPDHAVTRFLFLFTGTGLDSGTLARNWSWNSNAGSLDFANEWPGQWVIDHPDGDASTTWHRWTSPPSLTATGGPVLACTAAEFADGSAWPVVTYTNGAHTTLTSGPLGQGILGVRLVHAISVEIIAGLEAGDGARMRWVAPDGTEVAADPLEGYPGRIHPQALNPLHGQPALIAPRLDLDADQPLWRQDIVTIPESGPGPWRLRLEFAANTLWRKEGWFIAGIEPLFTDPSELLIDAVWDDGLVWNWPVKGLNSLDFTIQLRSDPEDQWQTILAETLDQRQDGTWFVAADRIAPYLPEGNLPRNLLRILGPDPQGTLAAIPIVRYRDGGDGVQMFLGPPWPNPSRGGIRVLAEPLAGTGARLKIFDARGRLVYDRYLAGGDQVVQWDGRTGDGRRLPSGNYFIRLEGSGSVAKRKVVLLH